MNTILPILNVDVFILFSDLLFFLAMNMQGDGPGYEQLRLAGIAYSPGCVAFFCLIFFIVLKELLLCARSSSRS